MGGCPRGLLPIVSRGIEYWHLSQKSHCQETYIKTAFNASVIFQIKVQQQGDTDGSALEARNAMRMFAGRAAVSVLHCWLTFDTHHRRNGSWLAVLLLMTSFGKQTDREKKI